MLAIDPLSLVFLACAVFSGVVLGISSFTGMGHGTHLTGHAPHVAGHATAAAPHAAAHAGVHFTGTHTSGGHSLTFSAGHVIQSVLNPFAILMFLFVFGVTGYLIHNLSSLGVVAVLGIAILAAVAAAVLTGMLLTRLFLSVQPAELTFDSSRLDGRMGEISMEIRGGGVGEVLFQGSAGGRQSIGARSVDGARIPSGTEVVIVAMKDGIASVQPWDQFLLTARTGSGSAPERGEPESP